MLNDERIIRSWDYAYLRFSRLSLLEVVWQSGHALRVVGTPLLHDFSIVSPCILSMEKTDLHATTKGSDGSSLWIRPVLSMASNLLRCEVNG